VHAPCQGGSLLGRRLGARIAEGAAGRWTMRDLWRAMIRCSAAVVFMLAGCAESVGTTHAALEERGQLYGVVAVDDAAFADMLQAVAAAGGTVEDEYPEIRFVVASSGTPGFSSSTPESFSSAALADWKVL